MFVQYEKVRIKQLKKPCEKYNEWNVNHRPPVVGDVGILVDILHTLGLPVRYVVEVSNEEGMTVWLSEFDHDEIEPF